MAIILEVPSALARCRRVDAVEALCGWIEAEAARDLPLPVAEAVVEVRAGRTARVPMTRGTPVGVHMVLLSLVRAQPDHRVVVALGRAADEDAYSWQGRLETVPHELSHMSEFIRDFGGRTPAQAAEAEGMAVLLAWAARGEPSRSTHEMSARRLVTAFLHAAPRWRAVPGCRPTCGCRPA